MIHASGNHRWHKYRKSAVVCVGLSIFLVCVCVFFFSDSFLRAGAANLGTWKLRPVKRQIWREKDWFNGGARPSLKIMLLFPKAPMNDWCGHFQDGRAEWCFPHLRTQFPVVWGEGARIYFPDHPNHFVKVSFSMDLNVNFNLFWEPVFILWDNSAI